MDVSTDDDIPAEQVVHEQIQSHELENSNPDDPPEQCIDVSSRLPKRNRKKPQRLTYNAGKIHRAEKVITFPITTSDEPTVKEAMNASPPEVEFWIKAIMEELNSLEKKKTWIPLGKAIRKGRRWFGPKGERLLPTHVVLKIKRNEHGFPVLSKARLVAGGHMQI